MPTLDGQFQRSGGYSLGSTTADVVPAQIPDSSVSIVFKFGGHEDLEGPKAERAAATASIEWTGQRDSTLRRGWEQRSMPSSLELTVYLYVRQGASGIRPDIDTVLPNRAFPGADRVSVVSRRRDATRMFGMFND